MRNVNNALRHARDCGVKIKRIHKVIYTKLSLEYGNLFDYEFTFTWFSNRATLCYTVLVNTFTDFCRKDSSLKTFDPDRFTFDSKHSSCNARTLWLATATVQLKFRF